MAIFKGTIKQTPLDLDLDVRDSLEEEAAAVAEMTRTGMPAFDSDSEDSAWAESLTATAGASSAGAAPFSITRDTRVVDEMLRSAQTKVFSARAAAVM